jgi:hypothetical protein
MKAEHASRSSTDAPGAAVSEAHAPTPAPQADGESVLETQRLSGNRALTRRLAPGASEGDEGGRETGRAGGASLLVEDDAARVGPGQMRRGHFMAALRREVCATADEGMAGTGRTSAGCPWIEYWFAHYADKGVAHLERAVRRFAPESAGTRDARELIRVLAARVRRSVDRWARTGEIGGLPEGVPLDVPGAGPGALLFFARPGAAPPATSPMAIRSRLGAGRPLEGGLRASMESAFGRSFAGVRTHADPGAARLAGSLNAAAFTVGEHVAFAAGHYRPGTLVGDALIAHELAHVAQQAGSDTQALGRTSRESLENDADAAAAAALVPTWAPRLGATGRAAPHLHAGLQLSRCGPSLRRPEEVMNAYLAARRNLLARVPQGNERARLEILLEEPATAGPQSLWGMFQYKLREAGRDTGRQAAAQQWLLEQLERLRGSIGPQLEMSARWGFEITSEPTPVEQSQRGTFFTITVWSADELRKLDAILGRIRRPYLANVRHVMRRRFDTEDAGAAAAWRQSLGTVYIYDPFFSSDVSDERRAEALVHELGHSLEAERTVEAFQHVPSDDWLALSDWRRTTRATLGADLGLQGDDLREALSRLDQARSSYVGFPRPVRIRDRMVVGDRYEGPLTSNRFWHYAAARDAEFVSSYARSHPADDLAESFAHFVLHPDGTRRTLNRGRPGQMDKWDYLEQLALRMAPPAAPPPRP